LQTDLPVHKDRPPEIAFYLSAIAQANWLQPSNWLLQFEEFMLSIKKESMGNQAILFYGKSSTGVKK
jgi:hypothetical protein